MMSITISSPSWTSDPSVLTSLIVLAGGLSIWGLGQLAAAIGRLTRPR